MRNVSHPIFPYKRGGSFLASTTLKLNQSRLRHGFKFSSEYKGDERSEGTKRRGERKAGMNSGWQETRIIRVGLMRQAAGSRIRHINRVLHRVASRCIAPASRVQPRERHFRIMRGVTALRYVIHPPVMPRSPRSRGLNPRWRPRRTDATVFARFARRPWHFN